MDEAAPRTVFGEAATPRAHRLRELAALFLRLGATAFGGPAAHTAMMEDEVVRRRSWLTPVEFLDLISATNLIPGPNSTELAIHIGHRRAGFPGLLVAGICFITPAVLIVTAIAWAYAKYGALPQAQAILYGIKPVIIAIVAQALWRLARTAVKSISLMLLTAAACVAAAQGVNELLILAFAGMAMIVLASFSRTGSTTPPGSVSHASAGSIAPVAISPMIVAGAAAAPPAAAAAFGLWPLFLIFLKIGSVLFGSGYVLLAFLRTDLVENRQWLTEPQLLDAIAVGQFTPGPVFTTATFIGFLLGGVPGAAVATVGIFLPAFVFVAISGPLVPRLRHSPIAAAVLDGVNAASLALMAFVSVQLAQAALVDATTIVFAVLALVVLLRWRINSTWLVAAGAGAGLLHTWLA